MQWYDNVRRLTLALVRAPSITRSAGETRFAEHMAGLLRELPYFQAHPEHLRIERTTDDLHERSNLYALVRGGGPRTIVLAGHFDVVSVENYGALAGWAFEPDALLPKLIADLEAEGRAEERETLDELRSGEYMVGRGALDMKSGLAAGMAVLSHLAADPAALPGSLLLIATPDEEENSHGMRSASRQLLGLAEEWGLELEGAINLDATSYTDDESEGRAVFLGTVGKLLPSLYIVGNPTHAGFPFEGVSATLLAASITRHIEYSAALIDIAEGEAAPLPVCLQLRDLKPHYDVTTPAACWAYYNVLTHGRSAQQVLALVVDEVRVALDETLAHLRRQAQLVAQRSGQPVALPEWEPLVLTYAELLARLRASNPAALDDLAALAQDLAADPALDIQAICLRLTEAAWAASGMTGPAAVVGLASLHYPRALVGSDTPAERRLREAASAETARIAEERATPIRVRPFFTGISDMSFLSGAMSAEDIDVVSSNTPVWGTRLRVDYGALDELRLPMINVGPWGSHYHQRTERVHMPYSFELIPELIWRIVSRMACGDTE